MQSHKLRDAADLRLAVSNDGELLAAAEYEKGDVMIFDTTDFSRPKTVLDVGESIGSISFSPDNSQLVTADQYFVRLRNINSRECRSFRIGVFVSNAAFTPDGTRVVSGRASLSELSLFLTCL